jgi:hypothetical protein
MSETRNNVLVAKREEPGTRPGSLEKSSDTTG